MHTGYPTVYRMTAAEFVSGLALTLTGGFIEIVDASGTPTGVMYVTGLAGTMPTLLGGTLASYRTAGEHLEHFRVVYDVDGVTAMKADPTDITKCKTIIGVTTLDTGITDTVEIISQGELILHSALPAGTIYLGAAGTLTQVIPTTGVFVKLGYVANADLMIIEVGEPIVLS